MPRPNRRTKVISIRLSHEEYAQLQTVCAARGVYSMSQLARAAMQVFMHEDNGNGHGRSVMDSKMNDIHVRVAQLDREVGRISRLMGLTRLDHTQ